MVVVTASSCGEDTPVSFSGISLLLQDKAPNKKTAVNILRVVWILFFIVHRIKLLPYLPKLGAIEIEAFPAFFEKLNKQN